jgi:hypothetical protein
VELEVVGVEPFGQRVGEHSLEMHLEVPRVGGVHREAGEDVCPVVPRAMRAGLVDVQQTSPPRP